MIDPKILNVKTDDDDGSTWIEAQSLADGLNNSVTYLQRGNVTSGMPVANTAVLLVLGRLAQHIEAEYVK